MLTSLSNFLSTPSHPPLLPTTLPRLPTPANATLSPSSRMRQREERLLHNTLEVSPVWERKSCLTYGILDFSNVFFSLPPLLLYVSVTTILRREVSWYCKRMKQSMINENAEQDASLQTRLSLSLSLARVIFGRFRFRSYFRSNFSLLPLIIIEMLSFNYAHKVTRSSNHRVLSVR